MDVMARSSMLPAARDRKQLDPLGLPVLQLLEWLHLSSCFDFTETDPQSLKDALQNRGHTNSIQEATTSHTPHHPPRSIESGSPAAIDR